MNKTISRVFILLIAFMMLFTIPALTTTAYARYSDYIDSYLAYLYSPGSNTVQVWFELKANQTSDKVGVTAVTLQVSDDQNNWETIGTYKYESTPGLMAYNTISHDSHISVSVSSGHYYRAGLLFYVERNGGSDSRFYATEPLWI